MGIFGSKYRTTVGTSVSRVMEDDKLPNSIKSGLLKGLVGGGGQLVENILEELTGTIGNRAESMYRYGKSTYAFGLPSSSLVSSGDGEATIMGAVKSQVGTTATKEYYHFGPLNRLHVGWMKLVSDHGYDSSTNQLGVLSIAKGSPVYLKDMVVVVKDATVSELANGSLDQWGISPKAGVTPQRIASLDYPVTHTPFGIDVTTEHDYVMVFYVWNVPTPTMVNGVSVIRQVPTEEFFTIPITGYIDTDYFQVAYLLNGKRGYWVYRIGENTIPEIEAVFDTDQHGLGSFFPFGYFRYKKISGAADKASTEYLSSVTLFKKLGMDYSALVDSVHENPDINDIEQAMMMMVVPANTTNTIEQRYLFEFFSKFYLEAGGIGMTPDRSLSSIEATVVMDAPKPKFSMIIQDSRFKMAISFLGMYKRRVAGVVGIPGSYSSVMTTETMIRNGIFEYAYFEGPTTTQTSWEVPVTKHVYRYQVSDAVYEEIGLFGLRTTYYVFRDYNTIGDGVDAKLLIPVDYSITSEYKIPEKEELYSRSLHYIFNSLVITKLAWYERGIFKVFLLAVAIVTAVVTYGGSIEAYLATFAAMSAMEIVIFIATGIIKMFLLGQVAKLFIKAIGVKVAFLIAIIAATYGVYLGIDAGSIAGAPWAETLLKLSSGLMSGVQSEYADMMLGLQEDALSFSKDAKEKISELKAAQSLLEQRTMLSPFVIFGETPDEFYNRTVHSSNIGIIGLDAVSSFVDMSLTLPKPYQTM